MPRFLSFLKGKKRPTKKDEVDSSMSKRTKETDIECKVLYLDLSVVTFYLEKRALGNVLENYTYHQIEDINDKNYFGLQFSDKKGTKHWLDMNKQVRKQCEIGPPYYFQFRVKFFSSDPAAQMIDEYTKYLFVLQLRQMIRDGELLCEDLELATDLAALTLQGELGDFIEEEHTPLFISQFRFLPDKEQTEDFELAVLGKYSLLKNRNMVPTVTDRYYLEKCRSLPDYGVDRHFAMDSKDNDYVLGLTPTGILIYEGNAKIGLFQWNLITKLSFVKNRFKIVAQDEQDENKEYTFLFQSVDVSACKQLWKSCVENHAFYRLEGSHRAPTKLKQLFRLKSRFHASFHTEYQMAVKNTFGSSVARSSTFQRSTSIRLAPRASFERNEVERRKIVQKYREQAKSFDSVLEDGDSNDSTPVASPILDKGVPTLTEIDQETNTHRPVTSRVTSQDSSIMNTSVISRQSSSTTIVSTPSIVDCVDSKAVITKPDSNNQSPLHKSDQSKSIITTNVNSSSTKPSGRPSITISLTRKNSKRFSLWRSRSKKEEIIAF